MTITRSAFLVMLCIPLMINADNFFDNTAGAIITSPANARGVDNVDCSLSDVDAIISIESKVCVINDNINEDFNDTFTVLETIESKVSNIEDKLDAGLCQPTLITDADLPLTISSQGTYLVTENLSLGATGTAITIAADNVTLDMCGFELSGTGANMMGILIDTDADHVVVKNGTVRTFQYGLRMIGGNDRTIENIRFDDIQVFAMDQYPIRLLGAMSNITFRDIVVTNSGTVNADTNFTLRLFYIQLCTNLTIENLLFEGNSATFANYGASASEDQFRLLSVISCENAMINNVKIQNNYSDGDLLGFDCNATNNVVVSDFMIHNNQALSNSSSFFSMFDCDGVAVRNGQVSHNDIADAAGNGLSISNCSSAMLSDLLIDNNTASTSIIGVRIFQSNDVIVDKLQVSNNAGGTAASGGIEVSESIGVVARNCLSENNTTGTTVVNGFNIESSQRVLLENCIALKNDNPGITTSSRGFFIGGAADQESEVVLKNCVADAHDQAGFILTRVKDSLFIDCISQNNDSAGAGDGFTVPSNVLIERVIFMRCIAQNNGRNGFGTSGAQAALSGVIFKQCQALNNGQDGLSVLIGGSVDPSIVNSVELKDCQGMFNGRNGFRVDATDIADLVMLKNAACNNGAADYVFVGGQPASLVVVAPVSSSSGWDNIDC